MKNLLLWELESLDTSIRCEYFACENGDNMIRVHNHLDECILEIREEDSEGKVNPLYMAIFGIMKLWKCKESELWELLKSTAPVDQDKAFRMDVQALEDVIDHCIESIRLIAF